MRRTQIYLSEEESLALDRAARASGLNRSQLIRQAIDQVYVAQNSSRLVAALTGAAGAWKGPRESGEEHVEAMRSRRMARLHRGRRR
ncbi:MAG: CopG family transcriptional regulator [Myxococcota bacterium]